MNDIIFISPKKFLTACAIVSAIFFIVGIQNPFSPAMIAAEVFLTIIALFVFGSIRYQIDKNALVSGAIMIIVASFWGGWWPGSDLRVQISSDGPAAAFDFVRRYFFTLHGLDQLFHADTMLFILGLTFFVAVIAQTRLLESVSFALLTKYRGKVVPTVAMIVGIVSVASGILDGVSMIGLMIRTLVIILLLAGASMSAVLYSVMISTVVTTVCGMWLAYGEPPNLIMKANLHPYLNDAFFLRYCMPAAVGSYFIVIWNIRKRLKGKTVNIAELDVLDQHTADVRFLQAARHGEVPTAIEYVDQWKEKLGEHFEEVNRRIHKGEPLGEAMARERVPAALRKEILGHYVAEDLDEALDDHYGHVVAGHSENKDTSLKKIRVILKGMGKKRVSSQRIGMLSFLPFIGLLVWHAADHHVPLFLASFAGFIVALLGIWKIRKTRALAFKEAAHEYKEYLFLLPLFLSITLLQKTGFFNQLSDLLNLGIEKLGAGHVAYAQFTGVTFLSAILDNNVVADFASRALRGLDLEILYLFSMAQIAGYAVGGCWTHIGSAQSVVAFSFIRKEIDVRFTPFQWIKTMTPVIVQIFILMTVVVYGEAYIFHIFAGK
ncbi:MAG: hypothetical protein A2901_09255 [Elusimicrobia bacterium RIFCSPLOWO2_01_FULL_54_10]|nr:MAG: hypothetical protein A2901_09255 [Elusimicrobia bacterium RIFCSPLOWO2_01_FULL_54_10]